MVYLTIPYLTAGAPQGVHRLASGKRLTQPTKDAAIPYLAVILLGAVPMLVMPALNSCLRAEGRMNIAMALYIVSAGINIALDVYFILILDWGTLGCAIATVSANIVPVLYLIVRYQTEDFQVHVTMKGVIPNPKILWKIASAGASPLVDKWGAALMMVVLNACISLTTDSPDVWVAANGAATRISMLAMIPIIAVCVSVVPLTGFNKGAGKWGRVWQTVAIGVVFSFGLSSVAVAIIIFACRYILRIFDSSPDFLTNGTYTCRVLFVGLPFSSVQMVARMAAIGLGHRVLAGVLSTLRCVVVMIPLLLVLTAVLDSVEV